MVFVIRQKRSPNVACYTYSEVPTAASKLIIHNKYSKVYWMTFHKIILNVIWFQCQQGLVERLLLGITKQLFHEIIGRGGAINLFVTPLIKSSACKDPSVFSHHFHISIGCSRLSRNQQTGREFWTFCEAERLFIRGKAALGQSSHL